MPVSQSNDSSGTTVGIEFKPYGVRLAFRPIVLSEGRISLQLSTEVSELSNDGAFTLNPTANTALVIPALSVRRASSTVELPSGGSLMIAGLLREETRQNIDKLPAPGDVPVLGALFRSRDYLRQETELLIVVTPYLARPTAPNAITRPDDGFAEASDPQAWLLGRVNRLYSTRSNPEAVQNLRGRFGFIQD